MILTWYSHDPHIHILHYLCYSLAAYTHGAYMRHVTHTWYTHRVTWLFTGPLLHHLHLVFSCNNTRHCNLLSSCGELVPIPPSPLESGLGMSLWVLSVWFSLVQTCMEEPCFDALRTKQQLGWVAWPSLKVSLHVASSVDYLPNSNCCSGTQSGLRYRKQA